MLSKSEWPVALSMAYAMVDYTRVDQLWFVHVPQAEAGWIFQPVAVAVEFYYYLWKRIFYCYHRHFQKFGVN